MDSVDEGVLTDYCRLLQEQLTRDTIKILPLLWSEVRAASLVT